MKDVNQPEKIQTAEEYLTSEEVLGLLKLTDSKLKSMIFKNEIPVIRLGRCLRFNKLDLINWIEGKKNYSFER